VGGYNQFLPYPDCFQSSAEIYDPATQLWTTTGNLSTGRYGITATLLADGRVLVVGGQQDVVELFDPSTGQWTLGASLFYPRFGHSATPLSDGRVLVTGGLTYSSVPVPHDDSLAATEIFDPSSQNWYAAGKLNDARRYHTATLLANGNVLAVGGIQHDLYTGGFLKLRSTELFDPTRLVWTSAGSLAIGRTGHTETALRVAHPELAFQTLKVLVAGGDNASEYSHALNSTELYLTAELPPVATTTHITPTRAH
jgi:N-acetylneuraminic acid mutarotase